MNRRYRALAVSGVLASTAFIAALIASGCGSTDCSFTASCLGSGTTFPDGGGDVAEDAPVIIPANCDLTKSPKDSPDCVADGVGIFVSAAGKPDGKGTKTDPFPTIAAAVTKAVNTKHPRVYICDGKYNEPIKLTSAVSVYGGFDCTWANTGVKPKITPPKGAAIDVSGVTDEVVIQDVDATGSSDVAVKGSSAIGALITKSKVSLRSVAISAGAGQDGAKGATGSNYAAAAGTGINAAGAVGGPEKTCTCTDGTKSIGGHGADGNGTNVSAGSSVPAIANPNSGGSNVTTCGPGTVGLVGEPDVGGEPIEPPGTIAAGAWDTSPVGGSGKNGLPGQGGGGGGARTDIGAAGGGGGCGGCGGAGAASGTNGGASIGVLSVESTVLIEASVVTSTTGGKGGAGGDGQAGQDGASGGTAVCGGGAGGAGAGGSGGAGGAGGDAFAIAWKGGTQPTVTATVTTPGTAGKPGDPGGPGGSSGNAGNPGKIGKLGRQQAVFTP